MIRAEVKIEKADCSGVIFAHGSRFGGHSLFIKDKKLYYVYNFLGIPDKQFVFFSPDAVAPDVVAPIAPIAPIAPKKYTFVVEFNKGMEAGTYGESLGETKLSVNGTVVVQGPMAAQVGKFTLCGDGLCVGYDSADAVSNLYSGTNPFTGGTIERVVITPEPEVVGITPGRRPRRFTPLLLAGAFAAD